MLRSNSKQSGEIRVVKPDKERLRKEGFAEKGGIKPRMKERVGDGIPIIIRKYGCWQIMTI